MTITISLPSNLAQAFAFTLAGETYGFNIITHPAAYTGTGGNLNITVGIDPTSANANDMIIPLQNVIATMNNLTPIQNNVTPALIGQTNPSQGQIDFESKLLEEMLQTFGLVPSYLETNSEFGYTHSSDGANNSFDVDAGTDAVIGTSDDVRGDDDNLNWFRKSNNDPFTIDATVDKTTYSRDLADLPSGHNFSTTPSRDVANALGYTNTESVMEIIYLGSTRRSLIHDEVAGLKYAMSGLDETAGTADDYTFTLSYAGQTTSANIVIDFDDSKTDFSKTTMNNFLSLLATDHVKLSSSISIYFNTKSSVDPNFCYFNTAALPVELKKFDVVKNDNHAQIDWITASEVNHSRFEVERKTEYSEWQTFETVYSTTELENGERHYSVIDNNFGQYGEYVYYRLKIVDNDESIEYSDSKVLKVDYEKVINARLSSNPVYSNTTLDLNLLKDEKIQISLYDTNGQFIFEKSINGWRGHNQILVGDLFIQRHGIYLMKITTGNYTKTIKTLQL